jgi:hypothetical protein
VSVDAAVVTPPPLGYPVRDPAKARWYADDADVAAGARAVCAAAGGCAAELVHRTGLVVFTPGCLVSGQLDRGLRLLAEAGFEVVLAHPLRFTDETVRRVWRYQLDTFRPDRWRLILDLLLVGPSLLLVLRDVGTGTASAAERLTGLKGRSDPRLGRPGELRTELGAMNKVINMVHSAEEPVDVVRETAILLDEATLRRVWHPDAGPVALSGDLRGLAVAVRPAGVSFVHTAAALRQRVVAALANRLPPQLDLAPVVGVLDAQLRWLDSADSRRPLAALDGFRHRFRGAGVTAQLRLRVPAEVDPVAARLLVALGELEAGLYADGGGNPDELWCACDQAGLPVDAWERLIVSTQYVTARMDTARG